MVTFMLCTHSPLECGRGPNCAGMYFKWLIMVAFQTSRRIPRTLHFKNVPTFPEHGIIKSYIVLTYMYTFQLNLQTVESGTYIFLRFSCTCFHLQPEDENCNPNRNQSIILKSFDLSDNTVLKFFADALCCS